MSNVERAQEFAPLASLEMISTIYFNGHRICLTMGEICDWRLLFKTPELLVQNMNSVKEEPVFRNQKSSPSTFFLFFFLYYFVEKGNHQRKCCQLSGKSSFVRKTCSILEICSPHGASPCKTGNCICRSFYAPRHCRY